MTLATPARLTPRNAHSQGRRPRGLKRIRGDNGGLGTAHRGTTQGLPDTPAQPRTQPAPTSPHFSSRTRGLWPPRHLPALPWEGPTPPGRSTKYELRPVQRTREAESGGGGEPRARGRKEPHRAHRRDPTRGRHRGRGVHGTRGDRKGGVTQGAQTQAQSHPAQTQGPSTQTQHTLAQTQLNREMLWGTKAPHT